MPTRVDVLVEVARAKKEVRYLEIGVQNSAQCFDHVPAMRKWGVDPNGGGATHVMSSDDFFAALDPDERFDLVFIDGDHRHPQVVRDTDNALCFLAPGGVVVMHDCLPGSLEYESPYLCGTAWRAFARLRTMADVEAFCGDFDHGVGVVRRATNSAPIVLPCALDDLTYDHLVTNRDGWMRPRSFEEVVRFASAP